ncbi:unnamed protein product [marine sediment metagenome]|uniref:Uncharacterized protein n=1 Tax=marine sediment metagenome TaxID=412755 RepID=X0Z1Q5_9ZZZZ
MRRENNSSEIITKYQAYVSTAPKIAGFYYKSIKKNAKPQKINVPYQEISHFIGMETIKDYHDPYTFIWFNTERKKLIVWFSQSKKEKIIFTCNKITCLIPLDDTSVAFGDKQGIIRLYNIFHKKIVKILDTGNKLPIKDLFYYKNKELLVAVCFITKSKTKIMCWTTRECGSMLDDYKIRATYTIRQETTHLASDSIFLSNQYHLIAATNTGRIYVLNYNNGSFGHFHFDTNKITTSILVVEAKYIVVGHFSGQISIWDSANFNLPPKILRTGINAPIKSLHVNPKL